MDLTFVLQAGRTVLQDAYCEVPFKITRLLTASRLANQPIAHLILMQCTAGLFGGDDVECSIRVERGARVRITQQSATRIHPSQDREAAQRNRIFVGAGAELQLYLEPVIPFAGSSLRQNTTLNVEPGGVLYFWESFMTGRVGSGESWQFREFASETELHSEGRLVYLDRFHLLPNGCQRSAWAMGSYNYSGTGLYVGENARCVASKLHQALPDGGIDCPADTIAAARILSASGPDFHRCRETFSRLADTDLPPNSTGALILQEGSP
jgi:urease accessory protein